MNNVQQAIRDPAEKGGYRYRWWKANDLEHSEGCNVAIAADLKHDELLPDRKRCSLHVVSLRLVVGGARISRRARHELAQDAQAGNRRGGDSLESGNLRRGCRRGGGEGRALRPARMELSEQGLAAGRGAVTVTSGSVAATWPQATSCVKLRRTSITPTRPAHGTSPGVSPANCPRRGIINDIILGRKLSGRWRKL
jgi:hypothetical protein